MPVETAAPPTTPGHPPDPDQDTAGRGPGPAGRFAWPTWLAVLVAVCVVAGVVARLWYLATLTTNADQAVVGLMAVAILHGHFSAFFWGQSYGGVEPYVAALLVAVFGRTAFALGLTTILLSAGAALLTWRAALRLVSDRWLAALAGALVWVVPAFDVTSTREYGFRDATLVGGLAALLLGLRILDGHRSTASFAGFGLVVGVAWWASPESVYFTLPAAALALGGLVAAVDLGAAGRLARVGAAGAAFVAGALPWLWSNVRDGFQSFNTSAQQSPTDGSYASHLHTFFSFVVPLQLGVRYYDTGLPVFGGNAGFALEWVSGGVVLVALVLCLARRGRAQVIGAAAVLFPFVYAVNPLAYWWQDGRYSIYLPPLAALVAAIGCEELVRRTSRGARAGARHRARAAVRTSRARALLGVIVLVSLLGAVVGCFQVVTWPPPGPTTDPNAATQPIVAALVHAGATTGYADYWIAYRLDYLSGGRLTYTPVAGDSLRSVPLYDEVARDPRPTAWLFVPDGLLGVTGPQFGSTALVESYLTEAEFTAALGRLGVPYRVVRTPMLDAVIPGRPVTPPEVGLGSPG